MQMREIGTNELMLCKYLNCDLHYLGPCTVINLPGSSSMPIRGLSLTDMIRDKAGHVIWAPGPGQWTGPLITPHPRLLWASTGSRVHEWVGMCSVHTCVSA